jgi:hypothetical protein
MTTLDDGYRYARPSSLEEALALMGEAGAMVLAGGQTLIPRLNAGIVAPNVLVDLGGLNTLKLIELDGVELTIGAMVSLADVIQSPALRRHCPLLPQAAEKTATPSIRNRGTLIGNLAWADPASQTRCFASPVQGPIVCFRRKHFSLDPIAPQLRTTRWSRTCTSRPFQIGRGPAFRTWRSDKTLVRWRPRPR